MEDRDKVRRVLKGLLSKRIYYWGSKLLDTSQVVISHGCKTYRLLHHQSKSIGESYASLNLKGYMYPIYFRPGTPDVGIIIQNIIRQEYGHLPTHITPECIIDGGCYIGDVSVYFLNRFKNCQVLALEPNRENFALAELNLCCYAERVALINKGLWSHEAKLNIMGNFTGSKMEIVENSVNEIGCINIETLVMNFDIEKIDIVKLDVEGAEQHIILENSENWLKMTRIIIVEFHGNEIKERCTEFLQNHGFEAYQYRSLHYFLNKNIS